MSDDAKPLDPEQMQQLARIRRFMMIASVTTFVAIAIVFAVIGYKVYKSGDEVRALPPALAPTLPLAEAGLPLGAKVLSTTIGERRVVLTVETLGGAVELHSFDLETLRPIARLRLESKP